MRFRESWHKEGIASLKFPSTLHLRPVHRVRDSTFLGHQLRVILSLVSVELASGAADSAHAIIPSRRVVAIALHPGPSSRDIPTRREVRKPFSGMCPPPIVRRALRMWFRSSTASWVVS